MTNDDRRPLPLPDREELERRALELHGKKYNCAQSVACTFAPFVGADEDACFRATEGLGAGMGGFTETCGAVTGAAVVIGMVYDYIPYMILPLYSIMAKMDEKLIEAARDLGCNGLGVLRRVIWPLSLPGVISGVTMVLIPSVSTFYISQKLGDGKIMLIGDVIEGQYVANNLHFAAAIAFILMILLLVCMAVMRKLASRHVEGGL